MIIKKLLLDKTFERSVPPIWLMRQAGRTLPEYKTLRSQTSSFWDMCFKPAFTVEATLQPIKRFDMDAAILFSDILTVPKALGQSIEFHTGKGPISDISFVEKPVVYDPYLFLKHVEPIGESIREIRSKLSPEKALIGFAGGPLTVACYMVEGQKSKTHNPIRSFIYEDMLKFDHLIKTLTQATIDYLSFQIEAGVNVIQIFESWAGILPFDLTEKYVLSPVLEIATALKKKHSDTPIIIFPRGATLFYESYIQSGLFDGISLDHQCNFPELIDKYADKICFQGGIDPAILLAGPKAVNKYVPTILENFTNSRYIANLSHGLDPLISIEAIESLIKLIRKGVL
ncbi:MAG: uroporphyrinogen decarboxylase [Rickettsiales bacterium]|nr:uroporphyrinogen decarboxylase [Rickettsiales bacterium]|tara:strand:+ start:66644 stop:67672 length:1029 start_codon:yes stop_codon:yes gene_type:complete